MFLQILVLQKQKEKIQLCYMLIFYVPIYDRCVLKSFFLHALLSLKYLFKLLSGYQSLTICCLYGKFCKVLALVKLTKLYQQNT